MPLNTVRMAKQAVPKHKRDGLLQSGIKSTASRVENMWEGGLRNQFWKFQIWKEKPQARAWTS